MVKAIIDYIIIKLYTLTYGSKWFNGKDRFKKGDTLYQKDVDNDVKSLQQLK